MEPAVLNAEFDGASLVQLGKFRLLALIARGGMGDIYLAISEGPAGFRKLVVVKLLRCEADDGDSYRSMFLDEGMLAARLNHPNVVQTHEVGETEGQLYLAMEYLEGQSLSRLVRAAGRLPAPLAARITAEALRGLHYAHELCDFDGSPLDIVHRDLSPQNIFITYEGIVKIVDFGIAKATLSSRATTEIGVLKGKLSYMAPEQASSSRIDRRADVFAMGIVLWELLTGRRLFNGKLAGQSLKSLLDPEPLPRVSEVLNEPDQGLDAIVARALAKRREDRYQTADAMRSDLEAYLARSGAAIQNEQIGRFVLQYFRSHQESIDQQVRACLTTAAPRDDERLPIIGARPSYSSGSSSGLTNQLSSTSRDIDIELLTDDSVRVSGHGPRYLSLLRSKAVRVGLGLTVGLVIAVVLVRSLAPPSAEALQILPALPPPRESESARVAAPLPVPLPVQVTALSIESQVERARAGEGGRAARPGATPRVQPGPRVTPRSATPAAPAADAGAQVGARASPTKRRLELVDDGDSVELLE